MSFASFPLDTLGLTPNQLTACTRASLTTAADILLPSAADLTKRLRPLKLDKIHDLVSALSRAIVPASSVISELVGDGSDSDEDVLRTGDAGLDECLGGGFRIGSLTEFTGESAAGKSHLCMSLALAAQVPALSKRPGGAIILTSERELSTDRLVQLGKTLLAAHDPTRRLREKDLLDNIHTSLCKDIEALDHALSFVLPALLRSRQPSDTSPLLGQRPSFTGARPIRLLVLDSITALLRGDTAFTSTSIGLTQRSRYLCIVTDRLKALALEYSLAVVVINQVSDVFARPQATPSPSTSFALSQFYNDGPEPPMLYATQARWFSGQSETLQKEASLGIVWANAINTRVMLSRTGRRRMLNQDDLSRVKRKRRRGDDDDKDETGFGPVVEDHKPTLVRRMHLVFSPFASPGTVDYVITPSGVHSLPDTYKLEDISETVKRQAKKTRLARLVQDIEDGNVSEEGGSQRVREESEDEGGREGEDDEFGGEVFDDLGDLPAEFWEGNFEAVGEEALAQGVAL